MELQSTCWNPDVLFTAALPTCTANFAPMGFTLSNENTTSTSQSLLPGMHQCVPSGTTCEFYSCLEANHNCEETKYNYPTNYGLKYCKAFNRNKNDFTSAGQTWLQRTRLCLQTALSEDVTSNVSCKQIEDNAFKSHPICYFGNGTNGICNLFDDWLPLVETVGLDGLTASPSQILDTAKLCIEFWSSLAESDLQRVGDAMQKFISRAHSSHTDAILYNIDDYTHDRLSSLLSSVGVSLPRL